MTHPDPTVQWLVDREQIRDLPLAYARGIDARDFAVARAVFADDAYVAGTRHQAPIDAYWASLTPGVETYAATLHFMGNQYVALEIGADVGEVEAYAVAYHVADPDDPSGDLTMGVRYVDAVERRGGAWIIAGRRVHQQWLRGPAAPYLSK
jgi:SnoaL-like protein